MKEGVKRGRRKLGENLLHDEIETWVSTSKIATSQDEKEKDLIKLEPWRMFFLYYCSWFPAR